MKVAPRVPRPLDEGLFCIFTDIFMNQIDEQEEYCLREALQRAGAGENPVRGCGGNGLVSGFLNISRKTRAFPRYPESDSACICILDPAKLEDWHTAGSSTEVAPRACARPP